MAAVTYFSRQSGDWNDPNTWSTVSHVGAAAADFPGNNGSDHSVAYISNGHVVTVTADHSGFTNAVALGNDTASTGTLNFSPTANTGLKFQYVGGGSWPTLTNNASAILNINAGTRTAPIRRGNTCNLVLGSSTSNGIFSNMTCRLQTWGQHRDMSGTDVYCDILTSNAAAGDNTIVINGDFSPAVTADDWLWIVEHVDPGTNETRAELIQIDSYNVGTKTATLKRPLRHPYTSANALVFKANKFFVNSVLTADKSSGATFNVADNMFSGDVTFPASTKALFTHCGTTGIANNEYVDVSNYVASSKSITASASSTVSHFAGSVVLLLDNNIKLNGFSSSMNWGKNNTSGTALRWIFAFTDLDSLGSMFVDSSLFYQSNLVSVAGLNGTSNANGLAVYAYGLGLGWRSTGAGNFFYQGFPFSLSSVDPNLTSDGTYWGRCRLSYYAETMFSRPYFMYMEDCVLHSATGSNDAMIENPTSCVFINCDFIAANSAGAELVKSPRACVFTDCNFSLGTRALELNAFSNCLVNNAIFGQNKQSKIQANTESIFVDTTSGSQALIVNGATFATGEPEPTFASGSAVYKGNNFPFIKIQNFNGVQNFRNFFRGGKVENDTVLFRTNSPSIKLTHNATGDGIWFDIPVFLPTGSNTLNIYTRPSTNSGWAANPQMLLIPHNYVDQFGRYSFEHSFVDRAIQNTLTTGAWTLLSLTYSVPTSDMYIVRLFARHATNGTTVNFDDFSIT